MTTKKAKSALATYLRKLHGSRALMVDLASPENVLSRARVLYPDTDPGQILEVMRKQHAALAKELERERTTVPLRKIGAYEKAEARPFYVRDNAQLALDQGIVQAHMDALTTECPVLTIGQAKASDFYSYYWAQKDEATSSEFGVFWPYGQYPGQLPSGTPTGVWSGETGAWFLGYLRVPPKKWWFDPYDMVAYAGVLQFTLPAPRCDSTVYWGTKGRVIAVDWHVTGQPAWADTDWVLYESPEGAGFPSDINAYSFYSDGAFRNDNGVSVTYDGEVWNRSFQVRAGVQSRIYLGLSFMLFGRNCEIELPGLQSYFNFDYGITYFMTPSA